LKATKISENNWIIPDEEEKLKATKISENNWIIPDEEEKLEKKLENDFSIPNNNNNNNNLLKISENPKIENDISLNKKILKPLHPPSPRDHDTVGEQKKVIQKRKFPLESKKRLISDFYYFGTKNSWEWTWHYRGDRGDRGNLEIVETE